MATLNSIVNTLRERITSYQIKPVKSGLFHFENFDAGGKSRIHLRIDGDGNGLLIVNASRIMHLNLTGAWMAYHYLNKSPMHLVIQEITQAFNVSKRQAINDYTHTADLLQELIKPDGACPIHGLDLDVIPPFSASPSAPYRMDLAITYRCNNDCHHCYNARSREYPELTTDEWYRILDRLWELGIPHIVFTGGEPTLRKDLPDLISHAEKLGQITGINTNGRRLADPEYVDQLVSVGLDHVQITCESHIAEIHDSMVHSHGAWKQTIAGLRNVLDTSLFVMTNTTMLTNNVQSLPQTLEFLATIGVPTVGLNALIYSGKGAEVGTGIKENELQSLLISARESTSQHNQRLIWYTPTQYCNLDPVQLELGVKGCTAAMYNMCIEPNGDVIPCQSYYQTIGNILSSPWDDIWNHQISIDLRERRWISEKCTACALARECGGGCPILSSHFNA